MKPKASKQPVVLVIDDERSIRKTFAKFLEKEGYRAIVAEDYDDALEKFQSEPPDIIVTDIILGEKSGVDLLRKVKEFNMEIPVVMVTGDPDLSTATDSLRLGAFDYLAKPVIRQHLLEVTFRALRHRELALEKKRISDQLKAVFEGVGEGLVLIDNERRIREINQSALTLANIRREQAIGQKLEAFLPSMLEGDIERVHQVLEDETKLFEATVEDPFERNEFEVVQFKMTRAVIGEGEPAFGVVVLRDISRLRQLERQFEVRSKMHNIIGRSKPMQEVYSLLARLRDTDTTALIVGESGTGKELAAAALHYQGTRAKHPFIAVNCTALNEQLLESELFGHAKGAFTGAVEQKMGRFEAAEGGTIFLDEIGDISLNLQMKLLRVLQERTFERVGESKPKKVDVRIIAATNRNLEEGVKKGVFREDLYYRLNVVKIQMPALRNKREDIPLLAEHFRRRFVKRYKKPIEGFSTGAMQWLLMYDWPGNVRELENAIEHAFIMSKGPTITVQHLPKSVRPSEEKERDGRAGKTDTEEFSEREEILSALRQADGNRSEAARILGVNRSTLYRKMQKFDIADPTK